MSGRRRRRPPARHQYVDPPYVADYGDQPAEYADYLAEYADYPAEYADEYGEYGDESYEERPRRRRRIVTPARFLLVLVLIGSAAVATYGTFFDRTRLQMPLAVSGLAVFGIALAILALMSARGAASLGREGSGGRALLAALFGGICAFGAAGSLAGAVVLGILSASA